MILENIVLLIPSLNPNEKLVRTAESMLDAGFSKILLVNDGSDEAHMEPFHRLALHDEITVIGYEVNQGKGYALKYGFQYVLDNYPEAAGVVTCDGDGQHLASDCVKTAAAMMDRGEVVLGCRNFKDPGVPGHNKLGNSISIFAYNYLCGIKLSDTQTGLRAFPRNILEPLIRVQGERFEYETYMLIYMKQQNIPFSEVPITTVYEEDSNEGSHFRIVQDSIKIYKPLLRYGGTKFLKFLCGSLLSAGLDLALFTVLSVCFGMIIFKATAIARVCSSIFNFLFNRGAVFHSKGKGSVVRYYILAVCQLCVSALLVTFFCGVFSATGFAKTAVKFVVDMILFFISYKIQREWVFKK